MPPHSVGVGPQILFGVYSSLRATAKLISKLFRITFCIVSRPKVHDVGLLQIESFGSPKSEAELHLSTLEDIFMVDNFMVDNFMVAKIWEFSRKIPKF